MRLSLLAVGSLCMALGLGFAPGCDDSSDNNGTGGTGGRGGTGGATGGTGGGTGGTGGATGGTGGSTGGTGGSTGGTGGGGGGVTYAMVQPIFKAKCAPCHDTGGTQGLPKFAAMFSETTKNVITGASECGTGTKVGACTIVRIKSGSMPFGKMCKPEAGQPPDASACLNATELATVQAWVDGGARE